MSTGFGVPEGPPWDVDVVADVHAGVYPADQTAELRRRIAADPQGAAILAALDRTVDDLSLLPALTMPEKYVLRMDTAIAGEYHIGSKMAAGSATGAAAGASIGARRTAGQAGAPAVLHGGIGALLRPGTAPSGDRQGGGPVLPRQSGPGRPSAAAPHLARRQPVIPPVLPGGLRPGQRTGGVGQPPTGVPQQQPNVSDLQAARDAAMARPTPVGPAAERSSAPRVGSLQAKRARRHRWTGGLLAAAAVIAVGAITAVALTSHHRDGNTGVAESAPGAVPTVTVPGGVGGAPTGNGSGNTSPGGSAEAIVVQKGKLGEALSQIEGKQAAGSLSNPVTYAACLGANKIDPGTVIGVSSVTFQGQGAFAIAAKQSDPTKVRVVIVGTECGTNAAADTLDSEITHR